ncbi:uncharacterized protein [Dermacentor andersoni]|uniref:uncharacterized protein isoform X3 n=1 Tax=Dermacentor andersoni TaxID=34620 RepID=UPI003B3B93D2
MLSQLCRAQLWSRVRRNWSFACGQDTSSSPNIFSRKTNHLSGMSDAFSSEEDNDYCNACNTGSIIVGYGSMTSYAATLDHTERPAVHAKYGLVVFNRLTNIIFCLFWLLCHSISYISGLRWIFVYFLVHFNTTILSQVAEIFKDLFLDAHYSAEVVPIYVWIFLEAAILLSIYSYYTTVQELEAEAAKKNAQQVYTSTYQ